MNWEDGMYKKLSQQQIFNIVAKGLLKQGRKSVVSEGNCVLITENGDRCAFGMLLPKKATHYRDTDLDTYYEQIGVDYRVFGNKVEQSLYKLHNFSEPETWRKGLQQIAEDFKLNADVLKA